MNVYEEIKSYISSKEINGALLLTGKWGSGKTYLMNEISKKICNEQNCAIAIISLFGIENTNELNRKIKENILNLRLNKEFNNSSKQILSYIKSFTSNFSEYSKIAKGISTALSINLYDFIRIENMVDCYCDNELVKKRLILVFDDFERSKIDQINLLGTINEYIENLEIKTILIADEEKICKDEYMDFKEKLIFRTLRLTPSYSSIINNIVFRYHASSKGYSEFIHTNINIIERVFYESGLENLRSLKVMINDFERVYSCWEKTDIAKDNIPNVLYTFAAVLFEYRANNYEKSEYGYLFDDIELKKKYNNYGENGSQMISLNNWITSGEWYEDNFLNEIKKYRIAKISEDMQFLMKNFWELNNVIISRGLPIVVERAYHGLLSCDELINLLQKVDAMNKYEIRLPCDLDYAKMREGLKLRINLITSGKVVEPNRFTYIMEETLLQMEKNAILLYRTIDDFGYRVLAVQNRFEFIKYLEQISRRPQHNFRGKYIISFDDALLHIFINQYKNCGNYQKRELAISLLEFRFDNSDVSESGDILESKNSFIELKSRLELLISSEEDMISKAITGDFIKMIIKLISKIDIKECI